MREWKAFEDELPIEHGLTVQVKHESKPEDLITATYCCSADEFWLAVPYKNEHGMHEVSATHWRLAV